MKISLKASGNGWHLYMTKPIRKLLRYNPNEIKILIISKENSLYCEPINIIDEENYKECMIRNLHKSGSGYGMYLPLPLLDVMGVNPETDYVDMEIDDNKFVLKKWKES